VVFVGDGLDRGDVVVVVVDALVVEEDGEDAVDVAEVGDDGAELDDTGLEDDVGDDDVDVPDPESVSA
jgi:hypothetical protein